MSEVLRAVASAIREAVPADVPVYVVGGPDDDHLEHWVCRECDENTAFCGKDVTDDPWIDDMPNECVVCRELVCPICGSEAGA